MEKERTLRDSVLVRWSALGIVAFTMMAAYFVNDIMAPLKTMLEANLDWTSRDFGFFTGAYSFLNVFLLMLIWGGLMLDRFGIRLTGKIAAILMVFGTALQYYGMTANISKQRFSVTSKVFLWQQPVILFLESEQKSQGLPLLKLLQSGLKGKSSVLRWEFK